MKTNLDHLKTDSNLEKEGIWIEISDDTAFKLRRAGGSNKAYTNAMAQALKPYARKIQYGNMDADTHANIIRNVFIKKCFVDWRGVKDDAGQEIPFSVDIALEIFTQSGYEDLIDNLADEASFAKNFKSGTEDLGNS